MRILITTSQVPFVSGGAEILAEGLKKALIERGHEAEILYFPFKWYPPERIIDCMLACRLIDITEVNGMKIDRVIGLKFPAYLIPHQNKVLWILHQHRSAYDLWDSDYTDLKRFPNGTQIREAIINADKKIIPEAKHSFTISCNVSKRLKDFCGIDSDPLYHPPLGAEKFYSREFEDYFFYPSRITDIKRQELVLEALCLTDKPVRVRIAGTSSNTLYLEDLMKFAKKKRINKRIKWLGTISEEEKVDQYANALGVIYTPYDEDYGYVTLEAMLSSKPVITCDDSGGPLEFIKNKENGIVIEATAESLASAMDFLWQNREAAKKMGERSREVYNDMKISWDNVVRKLLS